MLSKFKTKIENSGRNNPGSFAGVHRNFLCSGFRVITKPHALQNDVIFGAFYCA